MSRAKKTGQVVPPSGDGLSHQSSGASSDALRLDRKRRDSLRPDPTALTLRLMKVQAGLERLRLVPLEGLLKAHGMLSDLQAVEYGVSDMPKFALFSYRQVEMGLGTQRLSAKDVLCACETAMAHGCTHAWLDALCGLVAGEEYVHEKFLASLRSSLDHSEVVVVVGDGGCTEHPLHRQGLGLHAKAVALLQKNGVSEYLCRLWTRFELRAALQAGKLVFASDEHREALLQGRGFGIRSSLFFMDVTGEIPASLVPNPLRGFCIWMADLLSVVTIYFALLLFATTISAISYDPQAYVVAETEFLSPDTNSSISQEEVEAQNWMLLLFKLSAILLPLIAGPMGMRSLVLVRNSIVFRETATIHRLRRVLEKGDFARAAELADVSPYEMPCFEPCDRLIVAELMGKKRGSGLQSSQEFWATVLVYGLRVRANKTAVSASGRRVLRALLEEAWADGGAHWARDLLGELPPSSPVSPRRTHVNELLPAAWLTPCWGATKPSPLPLAIPTRSEARLRLKMNASSLHVHVGGALWPGLVLPMRQLLRVDAKVSVDYAVGVATLKGGGIFSSKAYTGLQLQRMPDRPVWRVIDKHANHPQNPQNPIYPAYAQPNDSMLESSSSIPVSNSNSRASAVGPAAPSSEPSAADSGSGTLPLERPEHDEQSLISAPSSSSLLVRLDHLRHFSLLGMDLLFSVIALVACLSISDDFLDAKYVAYYTSFSLEGTGRKVLDWVMVPAFACWALAEVICGFLSVLPLRVLRALGAHGREAVVGRYHGWSAWFLLVEIDLLLVYTQPFFTSNELDRVRLSDGNRKTVDLYFQEFWDTQAALGLRVVLFWVLFVGVRVLEFARFGLLAPRWLFRSPGGARGALINAVNPHFTGQPFGEGETFVDRSVSHAQLPPPPLPSRLPSLPLALAGCCGAARRRQPDAVAVSSTGGV